MCPLKFLTKIDNVLATKGLFQRWVWCQVGRCLVGYLAGF